MKKKIKKFSLNKKTISNLKSAEMSKHIGGTTFSCSPICNHCTKGGDCHTYGNGNTCDGHNTCYTC